MISRNAAVGLLAASVAGWFLLLLLLDYLLSVLIGPSP